jgi:hypothetical protein
MEHCGERWKPPGAGTFFPASFDFSFPVTRSRCIFNVQKLKREVSHESPAHVAYLKDLARRDIKRFSHSRSKSQIQKYVNQSFKVDGDFALGLPISILNLIWEDIILSGNKWVNITFNFK